MSNAFDQTNYPTKEPCVLVVGDRWAWKRSDIGSDYPPASYNLKYSLRLEGVSGVDSEEIEANASESGTDYIVEVGADVTADYTAGVYHWAAYIVDAGDATKRIRVDYGTLEVKADFDSSTDDPRTHAKKMLDLIEAALEGRATEQQLDVLAYSIKDRSATKDPEKLRAWRTYYQTEVNNEKAVERARNGGHDGRLVVTRMRG